MSFVRRRRMKHETKKEKERTTVFPMPLPGCHYATGPPSLLEEMYICEPYLP
jgi:hypothetical protein